MVSAITRMYVRLIRGDDTVIGMIRLIVSDHRFEPVLITECSVCGDRTKHGRSIALATVIERAQRHVREEHHGQQRDLRDYPGSCLPPVVEDGGRAVPGGEAVAAIERRLSALLPEGYSIEYDKTSATL